MLPSKKKWNWLLVTVWLIAGFSACLPGKKDDGGGGQPAAVNCASQTSSTCGAPNSPNCQLDYNSSTSRCIGSSTYCNGFSTNGATCPSDCQRSSTGSCGVITSSSSGQCTQANNNKSACDQLSTSCHWDGVQSCLSGSPSTASCSEYRTQSACGIIPSKCTWSPPNSSTGTCSQSTQPGPATTCAPPTGGNQCAYGCVYNSGSNACTPQPNVIQSCTGTPPNNCSYGCIASTSYPNQCVPGPTPFPPNPGAQCGSYGQFNCPTTQGCYLINNSCTSNPGGNVNPGNPSLIQLCANQSALTCLFTQGCTLSPFSNPICHPK